MKNFYNEEYLNKIIDARQKKCFKKQSQIEVSGFASETIYQVSQQWNKLDTGKKPRGYNGTGL